MANLKNTTIDGSGFLKLPVGTTADRPSQNNSLRFNSNTSKLEYLDSDWKKALVGPESGAISFEEGLTVSGGSANGTGLFLSGSNSLGFSVEGTERATLDSEGRLRLPYRPAFQGGRDNGSVSSGTFISDDVEINVGNHYNTGNGRFTCPVDGVYLIGFYHLAENTSVQNELYVEVNGTDIVRARDETKDGRYQTISACVIQELNANDYITIRPDNGTMYGRSEVWNRLSICLLF